MASRPHNNTMILRMIDWRACPVIEYVPGRVSGRPSFVGRRIQVDLLVRWLEAGNSLEEFSQTFHVDMGILMAAVRYLRDDPPVDVVDLAGCAVVEPDRSDGTPSFRGTGIPVRALFNFLKSGRAPTEFSDIYGLEHDQIEAVLEHAEGQLSLV